MSDINHLSTLRALSSSVFPSEMAAKRPGRSHQYAGNSVRETGERMNGGAVKEDKSPEKDAIDLRNDDQLPRWDAGTASPGCSVIT
jgi:hypothetical protein